MSAWTTSAPSAATDRTFLLAGFRVSARTCQPCSNSRRVTAPPCRPVAPSTATVRVGRSSIVCPPAYENGSGHHDPAYAHWRDGSTVVVSSVPSVALPSGASYSSVVIRHAPRELVAAQWLSGVEALEFCRHSPGAVPSGPVRSPGCARPFLPSSSSASYKPK